MWVCLNISTLYNRIRLARPSWEEESKPAKKKGMLKLEHAIIFLLNIIKSYFLLVKYTSSEPNTKTNKENMMINIVYP